VPDIPAEALTAAEQAVEAAMTDPEFRTERSAAGLSRAAVEAVAPVLADAIARKILAHMEAHGPAEGFAGSLGSTLRRAWRRHFGIAARIAAGAFTTDGDRKRMAAEALARGDYVACRALEQGEGDDGH
jgi:hypothetical protein